MTIALGAAFSNGQAFTALVIATFVLGAEILEHLTVARGREAIGDLLRYLPRTALVRRDGAIREVAVDELAIGDSVLRECGALVPVDGNVIAGNSFVERPASRANRWRPKSWSGPSLALRLIVDIFGLGNPSSFFAMPKICRQTSDYRSSIRRGLLRPE